MGLVFQHPLGGELAAADLGEDVSHGPAALRTDHPRPARQPAELGGVADRVVHAGEPPLVDEVDDELEFVKTLEIGDLRLVAGLDQGLIAGADQLGDPAAEHRLLAEKIGFSLLPEGGFEYPGAGAADPPGIGQGDVARPAGGILVHGDQAGDAVALLVDPAHEMARGFWGDHDDIDPGGRDDLAVMDVEAVGEGQHLAGSEGGRDRFGIDHRLGLVGQQHHDQIGGGAGFAHGQHLQPLLFGRGLRAAAGVQADDNPDAAVAQVEGVGMALAAVTEHSHGLALQQAGIGILFIIKFHEISFAKMIYRATINFSWWRGGHRDRIELFCLHGVSVTPCGTLSLTAPGIEIAHHGDRTGAGHLPDAEGPQGLQKSSDLGLAAGQFEGEGFG